MPTTTKGGGVGRGINYDIRQQYIHCQSTYGYPRSAYISYQVKALSRLYNYCTVINPQTSPYTNY